MNLGAFSKMMSILKSELPFRTLEVYSTEFSPDMHARFI